MLPRRLVVLGRVAAAFDRWWCGRGVVIFCVASSFLLRHFCCFCCGIFVAGVFVANVVAAVLFLVVLPWWLVVVLRQRGGW